MTNEVPDENLCFKLKFVAVFCVIMFILSSLFNAMLLWAFSQYKQIKNNMDRVKIAITVLNIAANTLEYPFVIVSNFSCRWVGGHFSMVFTAFVMYFVGCSSIYLTACISIERLKIPYFEAGSFVTSTRSIVISLLLGLLWPIFPLLGWSHYSLEGNLTSCSIEWADQSFNVVSYNITIFVCVLIIPVAIIVYCDIKLILKVKNTFKKAYLSQSIASKRYKRIHKENKLTMNLVVFSVGFLACWLPYGIVSMISALGYPDLIPPFYRLLPALFAKASMLWAPVFFIYSSRTVKRKLSRKLRKYLVKTEYPLNFLM